MNPLRSASRQRYRRPDSVVMPLLVARLGTGIGYAACGMSAFLVVEGIFSPKTLSAILGGSALPSLLDVVSIGIAGAGMVATIKLAPKETKRIRKVRLTAGWMTNLAVFVAGRERAAMGTEWRAHLSGESGTGLTGRKQFAAALGFVLAAFRYRLQDVADFAWRPVDAVLASRKLSNLFVLLATLAIVTMYLHHGGLYELTGNLEGVAVVWGAALGLIHVGRQWRRVKPSERKPRRTKR